MRKVPYVSVSFNNYLDLGSSGYHKNLIQQDATRRKLRRRGCGLIVNEEE